MSQHPVDALKELGLPMSPEREAEMRAICDEPVEAPRVITRVEAVDAILQQIKAGVDAARDAGVVCEYPEFVEIDGEKYSWERAQICFAKPRVITRVMDDGVKTKDGAA